MNLLEKIYWVGKMETPKLEKKGERSWWFYQSGIEIKKGGMLGSAFGKGSTEQEAIEDYWYQITDGLADNQFLIRNAGAFEYDEKDGVRVEYRWNGREWDILECSVRRGDGTWYKLKEGDYDPYRT